MALKSYAKYSDDFKAQAIRLAGELGQSKAARQLGVTPAVLSYWKRKHVVKKKLSAKEQAEADRLELERLRKETAEQKQVILILKKAAAFFSNDQLK